jgi:hypothetical protein
MEDNEQGTIILNKLTEVSYKINYYIRSLKKQIPDGLS